MALSWPTETRAEVRVKEQYVGDVNDYRKYALLRQLADGGKTRIGVCWMLTPADDGRDGNKTEYLDPEQAVKRRHHDPWLYDALQKVSDYKGRRRLHQIEQAQLIPGAVYFDEYLSNRRVMRTAFFAAARTALAKAPLIFFDPDNGIDVPSCPRGRRNSSKYIYRDEIAETYGTGHSVLIYQHFTRESHGAHIERLGGELAKLTPDAGRWCFRTPHTAFFLLVQPKHEKALGCAASAAMGKWQPEFLAGVKL